ncbi:MULTISPECIES: alternative ribosome rescue aminoacyl-tRNA hydrolase ArfB [Giesbergeria]|uniref:Alternative ribosome rescue aminoacyl-tRNA hydrolase ArfB n=1 Tax=Giesbergeria sinuosa TaxID=80883 RepID=A0ABV9QEJ3_9BURK
MPHTIHPHEVEFSAVRAQGPGGQNVNKVSNAIHLRFDIGRSSLPPTVKEKLLQWQDQRITKDGVIIIKAQSSSSREQNKAEALARLAELIAKASVVLPVRRATKPTLASKRRRLEGKLLRSGIKSSRGKIAL